MRNVEGGSAESAMRILRHEAGHAIDTRTGSAAASAGAKFSGPLPCRIPKPIARAPAAALRAAPGVVRTGASLRRLCRNLRGLAQANSSWRRTYAQWPAFHKLEFVDSLLEDVRGTRAPVRNREVVEPLRDDTATRSPITSPQAAPYSIPAHGHRIIARTRVHRPSVIAALAQRLDHFAIANRRACATHVLQQGIDELSLWNAGHCA